MECWHAEVVALDKLFRTFRGDASTLKKAHFYTSLEPCNHRSHHRVPCAHRIATLGFEKVHIGILDPDPNIYAKSAGYLVTNLGAARVEYAPRTVRRLIHRHNRRFVKRKLEDLCFDSFKDKLPIFTSTDQDIYLGLAHALSRNYPGGKLVWFFPKLPSFSDTHKFQAWWAQGALENTTLKEIQLIVHRREWAEGVKLAEAKGMSDMLLDEFRDRRKPVVRLYLVDDCDERRSNGNGCQCGQFQGALLYGLDGEVDCLILVAYVRVLKEVVAMFLACEPKYLAELCFSRPDRPTKSQIATLLLKLQGLHRSVTDTNGYVSLYRQLLKDLGR